MSEQINDGGPAFPEFTHQLINPTTGQTGISQSCGMSLRDWFAGQALAGALAASQGVAVSDDETPEGLADRIATGAYLVADAMLKQREKGPGE